MQPVTVDSVESFVSRYGRSRRDYAFRGQGHDHPAILAGVYRDLWPHRDKLPPGDVVAAAVDSQRSLEVEDAEVARALILWKVRVDRYFRFGFPLTELMALFFPDDLESVRRPEWKGTLGHLMAVHQHAGFKTTQLDLTWDPLVAAWFATHDPSANGWSPRRQGVVYVFKLASVQDRLRDLSIVPTAFPRPHRQRGLTIPSRWLEDLKPYIDTTVSIDLGDGGRLFEESGVTANVLFPDSEDPSHDLYSFWTAKGYGLPWLMDWIVSHKDSALWRLYSDNRKRVIIRLCRAYDANWVRTRDGRRLIPQWRRFDDLKLSGENPEARDWDLVDSDPWFSSDDTWGRPRPHPFANEDDEFDAMLAKLVESRNGKVVINWGQDA